MYTLLLYVYAVVARSMVTAHPGEDVELICTVTADFSNQTAAWLINHAGPYTVQLLHDGIWAGYSSNGNNLIIENIMMNDNRNGSKYRCVIVARDDIAEILDDGDLIITLYVAGKYSKKIQ